MLLSLWPVLFQAVTVVPPCHILSLLLVMLWWSTSSLTTTLLPEASMPPMLHHHHVSLYDRYCQFISLIFLKERLHLVSLWLPGIPSVVIPCCLSSCWMRFQEGCLEIKEQQDKTQCVLDQQMLWLHQGICILSSFSSLCCLLILAACGGTFHMDRGAFNSPGYPEPYPLNTECVWTILSSPGNRLQLSFM